jgi:hypothetical protein
MHAHRIAIARVAISIVSGTLSSSLAVYRQKKMPKYFSALASSVSTAAQRSFWRGLEPEKEY